MGELYGLYLVAPPGPAKDWLKILGRKLMKGKIKAVLAAVSVLAAGVVWAAAPADAATSVTLTARSIRGVVPTTSLPQNIVPVGPVSLKMAAGQTAYVVAVMRANKATQTSLLDNEIVCKLPNGTSKNAVIGQNI